jgi:hypothetical protein
MPTRAPKVTPYDLKPSQIKGFDGYEGIAQWVCRELDAALEARSGRDQTLKYAWALYEQQRTRSRMPWVGAADLTTPMAAEYVDSLHARLMTTIFTEPVWTVEGWGESAAKAPYVEEFHQRAQEDERLQTYADVWIQRGLVEGVGTLEVTESFEMRRERRQMKVAVMQDPMGQAVIDGATMKPALMQDEDGQYIEPQNPEQASAEVEVEELVPERLGPAYDVIPYLDFLTMPAHARDRTQVWGYAKRFHRRVPELVARAKQGVYDKTAVEEIGTENEREVRGDEAPHQGTIATQQGPTAQKELYEVQCLADFDGKGERWWRLTVHKDKVKLLRCKVDDRTTRYIRFIPFPKANTVDHGYSLVTDKMITVLEQDTAIRNMMADRMALKANQPLLKQANALWDPYEQPMGPGAVITVRDKNEISELVIQDVPASLNIAKADVRSDAERLVGQNEIAQGQQTEESRTLGEVQLQASYAEVRMNVIIRRVQEALEELFQARHAIWRRVLKTRGQNAPMMRALTIGTSADGLDVAGVATDGSITEELLDGIFWGKPKGSVETADLNRARADFNQSLQSLPALMKLNPTLAMLFRTMPAAKALIKQWARVNRVPDIQSFIGPEANGVFEQMQLQSDPRMQLLMAAAGGGMGGGQPQLGPGAPPAPGAPAGPQGPPPVM